ncbi:winged helix-turn-helix domain-containing protein [Luteipulveratus mongoliensis]|uniref:Cytoplasmic protein n=1 Tax=Luteipulveratus mongoliensis TaxID=571913 RepID=A0A0K1JH71_9MICO|nr:crosslink repair DNA glycosylase YcaQ family protein [Luteipulveratus mongoliensis]AKU16059.1 cytoplasmic protein [Luteipulveratus mongoliensis]
MPVAAALTQAEARHIWMRAQRLDSRDPFGDAGEGAVSAAVDQLGYVQIDTINVIERCHHHILWSRIPDYRPADLQRAQARDKSVFEYWTHALAYVPTERFRYSLPQMRARRTAPIPSWYSSVTEDDVRRVVRQIRADGPLTIRDFKNDALVEKTHLWASRKPSKAALELAFDRGLLTVSGRDGMVKTYDLPDRHFGWERAPRPATDRQVQAFQLDRALRAQGVVSVESTTHLQKLPARVAMREIIERRVRRKELVPVAIDGAEKVEHWAEPATLDVPPPPPVEELVHVLSPFDPLVIMRKRLSSFFGYDHVFEAYVPKAKRVYGYFTLPVLVGDEVVAAIDLKTDRDQRRLLVQQWTWVGRGNARDHQAAIDAELTRFERFQLGDG